VDELVERVDDQDRVLGMVVSRRQAIREGWLHRVAVTVCRDERGRFLVHRRPERVSRFPGLYEVEVGGAANVGESYDQAAARELAEELGNRVLPRLLFTFINRSGLSPHWLGEASPAPTAPCRPRAACAPPGNRPGPATPGTPAP
jgi:isopentenyldiphosphate isomerase